jgi:Putative thioesterase (yiiD_Cterm)
MDITTLPFNQIMGIKKTKNGSPYLLELNPVEAHMNHLGTVHAVSQLALAEASSAEYLLRSFKDDSQHADAVVRTVQAKFRRPLKGRGSSRARIADGALRKLSENLAAKGMGIVDVNVDIVDDQEAIAMFAKIRWFIRRRDRP